MSRETRVQFKNHPGYEDMGGILFATCNPFQCSTEHFKCLTRTITPLANSSLHDNMKIWEVFYLLRATHSNAVLSILNVLQEL